MEKQDKSQCDTCSRRRTTCIEGICPKCQVYINCDTRECRCNDKLNKQMKDEER